MGKFIGTTGLLYLWNKVKSIIPTKVSGLTNDSGFITSSDLEEKGYLQAVYDSMVTTFGLSYGGYTTEEIESPEWQYVLVDSGDRIVAGIKMNGTIYFPNLKVETT